MTPLWTLRDIGRVDESTLEKVVHTGGAAQVSDVILIGYY
jgi:hypothetical protein